MRIESALAIFFLFWFLSLFFVLPFQARRGESAHVAGQAESAPGEFRAAAVAGWTTLVAIVLFGLFYLNFVFGWITIDTLDWVNAPR
jgi:predicted secreted protein